MFQPVSGDAFRSALDEASRTPLFDRAYELRISMDDLIDEEAVVHVGNLTISGSLVAPALCALITGDLEVSDIVDLRREGGGDERGLFIVLGEVRCRHFVSDHGCCSIIDGHLAADQSVINDFSDSCMTVTGVLKTRLFVGAKRSAKVGAGAIMEYGVGYCLPIDYLDAAADAIRPQHDEAETVAVVQLELDEGDALQAERLAEWIRAGRPLFK